MTHGRMTEEVEKIVELQVDGKDKEAKELLDEIGNRYEEEVHLNKAEYMGKLRGMDRRHTERTAHLVKIIGAEAGLIFALAMIFFYHLITEDDSIRILVLSACLCPLCALVGAKFGERSVRSVPVK